MNLDAYAWERDKTEGTVSVLMFDGATPQGADIIARSMFTVPVRIASRETFEGHTIRHYQAQGWK